LAIWLLAIWLLAIWLLRLKLLCVTDKALTAEELKRHVEASQGRFAENLKALRKQRGWSQEDLSYHSKLHTTAISKIERGKRAPRFPTIVILAETLQVPAAQLFDGIPTSSSLNTEDAPTGPS
jgi:ribosome-binding protein aMBF1 (putative translation factor)